MTLKESQGKNTIITQEIRKHKKESESKPRTGKTASQPLKSVEKMKTINGENNNKMNEKKPTLTYAHM